eukprot:CAMPEP_0183712794 /NCGR_PEP_ID=MMETSP0737-20130205/7844_1 /TAXON_ID=385413 /ORGANISM="Thalassiosira miniscula, Strain CCMP1093" /LENGTH=708 /DNA_ID=CAMNT_0025941495 /DNA_START=239 /DNA_END=2365 /DNA_ORIENTATION=+
MGGQIFGRSGDAERCRHRRSCFVLTSSIALLILLNAQPASAFPTPGSHRQMSAKGSSHSINHRSINGAFCSPYAGYRCNGGLPPELCHSRRYIQRVAAKTKDQQEEFQRELLGAKIANDIENTKVKEEKERNEVVAESIRKEKEELKGAVKEVKQAVKEVSRSAKNLGGAVIKNTTEVKEAVQDVSQSGINLGGAFINQVPGIFTRLLTSLATGEMRNDFLRRRKHYVNDWTVAFSKKRQVIPAILFLYFACLSPAVSFGTISSEVTNGSMGVVEYLLGSGIAGMLYSILCGQPMAFIAPTGLTLAFISGLFRFCNLKGLPFLSVYAWVGIWTSAFMSLLGLSGSSKLIRFCTRFTDEVFNGMLSVNFIYEALSSLRRNFVNADPMNLSMPFVALSMALGTFFGTMSVVKFEASKFFNTKIRKVVKNFGPVAVILLFSLLNLLPWAQKFHVPTLSVPDTFQLAGGRGFLVGLKDIPVNIRLLCAFPACLLTSLFFMDQNISVRLVNNPDNKMKKGAAYNLDMIALGIITGVLSILGLPWMCGATVQSMNHVRALAESKLNEKTGQIEITEVTETRLTGFVIHAMLASTVLLLPLIKNIPIPVVSGVFLFLGRKLMTGNTFFRRISDAFAEKARLQGKNPIHLLGRKKMNIYTGVQVLCLMGLFGFKQIPAITIFFPAMIGVLMSIRAFVLPKFFSEEEFAALKDPTPT